MILDYLNKSKKGEIVIPPFHNGHLGFMPHNYATVGLHFSNRGVKGFRDCELIIDQFHTSNSNSLFKLDCTLKDQPGVVQSLLNAIAFFEINIVNKESSAINAMYFHHVSMILDWSKSNNKEKKEISPSAAKIYGKFLSIIPDNDARYIDLFEKIMTFCGDRIKIKGGFPEISFTQYDLPKTEEVNHFYKIKKYNKFKTDKFYVSIDLLPQTLRDIKRATGYDNKDEITYIPLSDTNKKFLRVLIPKKSRAKRLFHIGFSHLDEPGALTVLTELLARKKFNIQSCLLRRDKINENSEEKRNIWETILEYNGNKIIPNETIKIASWLVDILIDLPEGKSLINFKSQINYFKFFVGPPRYPKSSTEGSSFKGLLYKNIKSKRFVLKDDDFFNRLEKKYKLFKNDKHRGPNDTVRFDILQKVKKQLSNKGKSVFISYSYPASDHAKYLKKALRDIEFKPIELQNTPPGKNISEEAIDRITNSDFFIGIWHPEIGAENNNRISPWMPFEFGVAKTLNKRIILMVSSQLDPKVWNRIDAGVSKIKYKSVDFINVSVKNVISEIKKEWK